MSPTVSFLGIVSSWPQFLHGEKRSDFYEAVGKGWMDRQRIERLTRRFTELLNAKQQSLDQRVAMFIERCAADPRIANNRDYLSMTGKSRELAFEKIVTGAGLIMRDQLPLKLRRNVRRLSVDWNDPMGSAQWEIDDNGLSAFKVQNAIDFAAKHVAGMNGELAALVAERLTAEFRRGTMELTSLLKTGESGNRTIYQWQSASVSLNTEPNAVDDHVTVLPKEIEVPLFVWLRDEREISVAEIKRLTAHRPELYPWRAAKQLAEESKKWVNPVIVDQVKKFVQQCVMYSRADRTFVAKEIALTVFHELAKEIAANRDARRAATLVEVIEQYETIGSTAKLILEEVTA